MTKSKSLRIQMVAAVTAMILVSFMVVRTSSAAFTGSVSTSGESITAGTVSLTSDDVGSALFTLTGLLPGATSEYCVDVKYDGDTAPGNSVEFFGTGNGSTAGWLTDASGGADGTDLDDQIDVSVYAYDTTCATTGSISALSTLITGAGGTLAANTVIDAADLSALATSASPVDTGWSPSGQDDTFAFYIKVDFPLLSDASVQNQAQGDAVTGSFTWQVEGSSSS